MSARAEFGPLSWEEIEQNLRETTAETQNGFHWSNDSDTSFASPISNGRDPLWNDGGPAQWKSLLIQCEQLRNEIRRGHEYLDQLQEELSEHRALLEKWPAYERQCGRNPLPQLIQSISVNEGIEEFLPRWVKRQEEKLATLTREMEELRNPKQAEEDAGDEFHREVLVAAK